MTKTNTNQAVKRCWSRKDYSYEAIVNLKRENPYKPTPVIIKELNLDVSKSMVNRILRNAKAEGLL